MIRSRHKRTAVWGVVLAAVPAVLTIEIEDRASGPFQLRPVSRVELRAPVAGFLQAVYFDEGDAISPGSLVARIEVPDLTSRIGQKRAEIREAQAKLRLLDLGPRPEELAEQRRRVERASAWRNLAEQDLQRSGVALQEELTRLDEQIAQYRAELNYAESARSRAEALLARKALAEEQMREVEKRQRVCAAQLEQAQAQKRARQALGTQEQEAELARREKELAEAKGSLTLLEAGTRPEEIEAERARLARLEEESRYLEAIEEKVRVHSSSSGIVTTAHLKEKVGQYLQAGEFICEVQDQSSLEIEVALNEQEIGRIQPGQTVRLMARAAPFRPFDARVDRAAPSASRGDVQSTVAVYCRAAMCPPELRPGTSGWARIQTGRRSIGEVLIYRAVRFLRTEFWW